MIARYYIQDHDGTMREVGAAELTRLAEAREHADRWMRPTVENSLHSLGDQMERLIALVGKLNDALTSFRVTVEDKRCGRVNAIHVRVTE